MLRSIGTRRGTTFWVVRVIEGRMYEARRPARFGWCPLGQKPIELSCAVVPSVLLPSVAAPWPCGAMAS